MEVMFSERGLGTWNKLWILNLANKSVHTLFSFWEICWERGGMKARKEDVERVGKSQRLPDHPPEQRLSCCWLLFPAGLCEPWSPRGAAQGAGCAGGSRWSWVSAWISGCVSLPLGYIYAELGFWGSVIQLFQLPAKGVASGGEPFLTATVRAQGEPDKAEMVHVLLQE